MVLPMVLVIGFMYLIIYVPQKRQDKKDAAMRNSIEIGDEVTTIGGVVGLSLIHISFSSTMGAPTGSFSG